MSHKKIIFFTVLSFLLFLVLLTAGCTSIGVKDSSIPVIENLHQTSIIMESSTDPDYFNYLKNAWNVVAIYGNMPSLDGTASYAYFSDMNSINASIQENMTHYLENNGGPIVDYYISEKGYLIMLIDPGNREDLRSEDIEEIMGIINEAAENEGIQNIPVVFYASRLEMYVPMTKLE